MEVHREVSDPDVKSSVATNENQTDNIANILPIEQTNSTRTCLDHLNDDCLLEIFANNSLTPMDLCSLAEACQRFKQVTQRALPNGFELKSWRIFDQLRYSFKSPNYSRDDYTLQDVKRILRNFAPVLTKLEIGGDQVAVNSIAKYWGSFQRLVELNVHHCYFPVASTGFNFDSLIELTIFNANGCDAILRHTFPNLERFYWFDFRDSKNSDILFDFIRHHRHLKTIDLQAKSVCISGLLHVISNSCKELEHLILENWINTTMTFDILHLQSLTKLELLHVDFGYGLVQNDQSHSQHTDLSQALKALDTLKLCRLNEVPLQILNVLPQLQNLRELHLMHCSTNRIPWAMLARLRNVYLCDSSPDFYGSELLNVIRQVMNLEELHHMEDWQSVISNYSLSEEIFSEIVKIVEPREHVLTLKCNYNFTYCQERHGKKVKLIKRKF